MPPDSNLHIDNANTGPGRHAAQIVPDKHLVIVITRVATARRFVFIAKLLVSRWQVMIRFRDIVGLGYISRRASCNYYHDASPR